MRLFGWLFKAARQHRESLEVDRPLSAPPAERQVLLVTMLGVEQASIADIVDRTSAAGIKVVYLTDTLDFAVFRHRKATFEYIPPLSEQSRHAGAMNWPRYLRRRWALIEAKWAPTQLHAYGMNFDRFLTAAERADASCKP
ncbi:hypothetical protein [Shinella sp. M27]|uniref:hypothetical protein n=1 Tax=Shinella sp. M27 TaxID=3368614 RepID=UPI003B9FDC4A